MTKACPEGTLIPSQQWVRLQFCPKNSRKKAAAQFCSRLPIKMMVQKCQFRQHHIDSHYSAAIFRYLHEYAVMFRESSLHGESSEPGTPLAAAEIGQQVLVTTAETLEVCDHDLALYQQ